MKKPKIFIACDTTSLTKVKKIIKQSKTNKIKIGYKFGLEFMNSKNGRGFVSKLRNIKRSKNKLPYCSYFVRFGCLKGSKKNFRINENYWCHDLNIFK
jgi:hypothetical protein